MVGNVKFRDTQKSGEKQEQSPPLKELAHDVHTKEEATSKKVESSEGLLKRIDDDWQSGKLRKWADVIQKDIEKYDKEFKIKKNEGLTEEMMSMMGKIGRNILSEKELKEAKEKFKGAFVPDMSSAADTYTVGREITGWIEIFHPHSTVGKYHELAHHIHSFIRIKQLESGDIKDPILKKLYGYLHNAYSNEVIDIVQFQYKYVEEYYEKIANAISLNCIMSAEVRDSVKNSVFELLARHPEASEILADKSVIALADFLRYQPKLFRKLMEDSLLAMKFIEV